MAPETEPGHTALSPSTDGTAPPNEAADEAEEGQQEEEQKANFVEWIIGLLGALIVLGTIGFLLYKIIGGVGKPPDLRVTLGTPEDQGNEIIVPVEVKNEGGSVAAEALIEVCAGPDECAELTFAYVPHASVRRGKVGFSKPMVGVLTTRVVSYREP